MEEKDNINLNINSNGLNSTMNSDELIVFIPDIPLQQIVSEVCYDGGSDLRKVQNISNEEIEETFNIIEISPHELIHIKKVPKFKIINNYIKGEVLGEGVFGKVREFVDKNTLERRAAKIMKIERISRMGRHVETNIKTELKLVNKLNHKNVIKMFDTHKTQQKIYIFMEYCAGVLTEIIDSAPLKKLPIYESHNYFSQTIEGLQYLHSKGIFHRDIKTDNLLINSSNVIKIADFGVCFVLISSESNDLISGFEGTKLYQPPELLDPQLTQYSGSKFDIWSSGVLLFNMISGIFPFFNNPDDDIWDIKSYQNINYPQIISDDPTLQNLFQRIFVIDFNDRITIEEIKQNPWFVMNHSKYTEYITLPDKQFGDIYRGTTVLERIRVHLYEPPEDNKKIEFCNEADYEESVKLKPPSIRTDRIKRSRTPTKKRKAPFTRLIRLGLNRSEQYS